MAENFTAQELADHLNANNPWKGHQWPMPGWPGTMGTVGDYFVEDGRVWVSMSAKLDNGMTVKNAIALDQ